MFGACYCVAMKIGGCRPRTATASVDPQVLAMSADDNLYAVQNIAVFHLILFTCHIKSKK